MEKMKAVQVPKAGADFEILERDSSDSLRTNCADPCGSAC